MSNYPENMCGTLPIIIDLY